MMPDELKGFPDVQAVEAYDRAALLGGRYDRGELTLQIAPQKIVAVCRFLKAERGYSLLSDLTATDGYPQEPRFQVVYHLHAMEGHQNLRLKAGLPGDDPRVDTVTTVWPAAGWFEREVFDLFGIVFTGHPDLRRLLMPDNWQGHPLRKDYPTEGVR